MSYNLYINGSLIDRGATNSELVRITAYQRGGMPSLQVRRKGVMFALTDSWDNQPFRLTRVDPITLVETTIFSGASSSAILHYVQGVGWVREWNVLGLRNLADYYPVTDSVTQTDVSQFNLPGDDITAIASRQGRTIGQMVIDMLEMPANKAALIAAGVGNYVSPSGSGAAGSVTTNDAGQIQSVTLDSGGTGYAAAPTIVVAGGGGMGAVITATMGGGSVTALTITNAGSGYTTTPTLIFSTLPAVTINDCNNLFLIPPYRSSFAGERLLQTIESNVTNAHPNHVQHVDANGYLRFLDQRTFAVNTLTMDGSDPRVGQPSLSIDWNSCYAQVEIRGNTVTQAKQLQWQPTPGSTLPDGGLQQDFAHDGLSNAQAIAAYSPADFSVPNQPSGTAGGLANTSGGKVIGITVSNSGYGYTSAPAVLITGGGGSGATATATVTAGAVTGFTVTAQGSGYVGIPTVTVGTPGGAGQYDEGSCTCSDTTHLVCTSINSATTFPADYWDQTVDGHQGVVIASSDTTVDETQKWQARVVASTAKSAGGTFTLTLDNPLPSTTYNSYALYGTGGGASVVWRRYKCSNAKIGASLLNYFPYPFAMPNSDGTAATLTTANTGTICYSQSGTQPYQEEPMGFSVDPTSGTITFNKPVSLVFGGGTVVTPPSDVRAFVAVAGGLLQAFAPSSSSYSGTAHSLYGITFTKVVTLRDWTDYSNQSNMNSYASELLDSLKDVFVEGTIPYYGELPWALTFGQAVQLAGNGYTTGLESMPIPIIQLDMDFNEDAQGATSYFTTLHISNRRELISSEMFLRPSVTGAQFGGGSESEPFAGNAIAGMSAAYGGNAVGTDYGNQVANNYYAANNPANIPTNPSAYLPSMADWGALGASMDPSQVMPTGGDFAALGLDDPNFALGGQGGGNPGWIGTPPAEAPPPPKQVDQP